MEGFHYYYHPVFQRLLAIIKSGEIGEVIKVESALLIPMPDKNDLRLKFDLAGGSIMDVGFVRELETALISVCAEFGVKADRYCERSGVWVRDDKSDRKSRDE